MRRLYAILAAVILTACVQEVEHVTVYELGCPESTQEAGPEAASLGFKIYTNGAHGYVYTKQSSWLCVSAVADWMYTYRRGLRRCSFY